MFKNSLKVGLLLGWKQIRHTSLWTNTLIIFVMTLTFLNLVVVSGILVGLIEGSVKAYNEQYTSDIYISTQVGEEYIEQSYSLLAKLENTPGILDFSPRATVNGVVEANYRTRRDPDELKDTVGTKIVGIDAEREDFITNLRDFVISGEYLNENDSSFVLVGANLLDQYAADFGEGFDTLENVEPGTKIRITANERTKEYIVKGIIDSKVDETSRRVFMNDDEFTRFVGRTSLNINEIAVKTDKNYPAEVVKQNLLASGAGKNAVIRLSREALPQALEDIIVTFEILGNAISSIGLLVSSITIFIVIFVNAITRRKYIGILKGIGVRAFAIEFSYIFQSLIYALVGASIAIAIIYGFLVPFFNTHPIDFPFSDGILVAPVLGTAIRLIVLTTATLIAGYIPAWLIIKKNTLDSILGR